MLDVAHFHPKSSEHRPRTRAKVLYDNAGIYVLFHVADRYVRCVETRHQGRVWLDSCVEFFVQPTPTHYFNIEITCGGTILLYRMPVPPRGPDGKFAGHTIVPAGELDAIRVYHSLPRAVPDEIAEPVDWCVEYFVPDALLERYAGPLPPPPQRRWLGNFYKCADASSHPHWAAWAPIERFDFHQPECFGSLAFE